MFAFCESGFWERRRAIRPQRSLVALPASARTPSVWLTAAANGRVFAISSRAHHVILNELDEGSQLTDSVRE